MASVVGPSKSRVIVGGRGAALSAGDIFNIAGRGSVVEVDKSRLEKLIAGNEGSEEVSLAVPEAGASNGLSSSDACLSNEQSKALLAAEVIERLIRSTRCSPKLIFLLTSLVNAEKEINLPVNFEIGTDSQVMDGVLKLVQHACNKEDANLLRGSRAGTIGLSAVSINEAQGLLSTADSVVALTCEAMQAVVTAFEAESSGHKGQTEVASDLRSFLAGSTSVNPRKGGVNIQAVVSVPQCHGAARESLKSAASAVRLELNGGLEGSESSESCVDASVSSDHVVSCVLSALQAFLPVLARSRDRAVFLRSQLEKYREGETGLHGDWQRGADAGLSEAEEAVQSVKKSVVKVAAHVAGAAAEANPSLPGVRVAVELGSAVSLTRRVLALESVLALALIGQREAELAVRQGAGAAGKGKPQVAEVSEGKGGKAAKEAKEGKKGKKGGGAQLGRGSAILRSFLEAALLSAGQQSADLPLQVSAVVAALDPRGGQQQGLLQGLRAAVESNDARRVPKIAKGTRDFLPEQMAVRERLFGLLTGAFKRHGGVEIDTPVFELRETLTGKYGEDSKLIYDLADQGGEVLSLRYDLTVPFARFLAMHPVGSIRRYHIGKVYRRDNPQMKRGRFREFYQCDFDIAGPYPTMIPDAEILAVLTEILDSLALGPYEVKVNHRGLLDGMLAVCGVPAPKFRAVCSAIDKLDKEPWEAVREELVAEKGLPASVADQIGTFVSQRGAPADLLPLLQAAESPFAGHEGSAAALAELALLTQYLEALGALPRVVLDLSLARGLDYYTGMIFEAVVLPQEEGGLHVGSVAAGGRYDGLVGMFSGKAVPSVGLSVGVERVFALMMERAQKEGRALRATHTQVLVASIGPGMLTQRMQMAARLWGAGVKAEYLFALAPNMQRQLEYANRTGIPWMVLFGADELAKGSVKLKDLERRTEEEVSVDGLLTLLLDRLATGGEEVESREGAEGL